MIEIRPWQTTDSIPELTSLMHRAYAPLMASGLNFTAATQTDQVTKERAEGGITLVARGREGLVGAITLHPDRDTLLYRQPGIEVIGPFAVAPENQGRGIGTMLMRAIAEVARERNLKALALDTAEPEAHLQRFYEAHGFRSVGYVNWGDKTYRSVLMAKWLATPLIRPCVETDATPALNVVESVFREYGFTWDGSDYFADLSGLPNSYPDGFWVAEHDGAVAGVGGLEKHESFPGAAGTLIERDGQWRVAGTDGELVRMYVLHSARRQGIGRGIGNCIVREARYQGMQALEIWSDKKLTDAHRLYQRMGARLVGERICDDPDESPEWGFYLPLDSEADVT